MPNQDIPSFEENFDTPEFIEANSIPFDLRRRRFRARRIPIGKLREYQAEAAAARGDQDGIAVLLGLFRWVLTPSDLEVFEGYLNDEDNPMRLDTIQGVVQYISSKLVGAEGDEDEDPKGDDSSPSPAASGTPSTTSSPESSESTPAASASSDT